MVAHLMAVIDDAGAARDEKHLIETTRLVCDHLRTWYLAAAGNQPGRASASDLGSRQVIGPSSPTVSMLS
jgi:hypothetical protein